MNIGDKVKLKKSQSKVTYLQEYKNKTGTIIDEQGPYGNGKKYYRVGFSGGSYIDVGSWRVERA